MNIKMLVTVSALFIGSIAFAERPTAEINRVEAIQAKYLGFIYSMQGVNMVGLDMCNKTTGKPALRRGTGTPCLLIGFETQEALENAEKTFAPPFEIDDTWVNFEYVGTFRPL